MYFLNNDLFFPDPNSASIEGIVAVGGDLSIERLILAYKNGIFPWFNEEDIPIWWSPDPRSILFTKDVKISKSMRNVINRGIFTYTVDKAFTDVLAHCRNLRKDKEGTWITEDIMEAYYQLHKLGYAHSVEVWQEEKLVGGLYGVSFGKMFFGESMFSLVSNSSKAAFIYLAQNLSKKGYEIIDCQVHTEHLGSLGAIEVSRKLFLEKLEESLKEKTIRKNWIDLFSEK